MTAPLATRPTSMISWYGALGWSGGREPGVRALEAGSDDAGNGRELGHGWQEAAHLVARKDRVVDVHVRLPGLDPDQKVRPGCPSGQNTLMNLVRGADHSGFI